MSPLVRSEVEGSVTVLSLARPERHNALVPELLSGLSTAIADLDARCRVVLLRADGRSFSTGGDLAGFAPHVDEPDELVAYAHGLVGALNEVVLALSDLPVPLVVAMGGPVTGGSLGLLLPADVIVAGESAWLQPYYAEVGFSPDGGWTALLPRLIGRTRAADTLVRDRRISAAEAAGWGLISQVVPDAEVEATAWEVAHRIAGLRPGAHARMRQLLAIDRPTLARALEDEREAFCVQVRTDEARTGIREFLAGRTVDTSKTGGH